MTAPAPHSCIVASNNDLRFLISDEMKQRGPNCDLNHIDVSEVTDFSYVFENSKFNGDISKWNMRRAQNLNYMFSNSEFNGDISQWDVSNVLTMQSAFSHSAFQGDISRWDVRKVNNVFGMFLECPFDGDLSAWNLPQDDPNKRGIGRFVDFVAHSVPGNHPNLRFPELPIDGYRLFLSKSSHLAWLQSRADHGDFSRYHWDALLTDPTLPWATKEMQTVL